MLSCPLNYEGNFRFVWKIARGGSGFVRATPVVIIMCPCKWKSEEEKWKHVGLAPQNGFWLAFLHTLLRPVRELQERSVVNMIWPLLPFSDSPILMIVPGALV